MKLEPEVFCRRAVDLQDIHLDVDLAGQIGADPVDQLAVAREILSGNAACALQNRLFRHRVSHVAAHDNVAFAVGIDANVGGTGEVGNVVLQVAERMSDDDGIDDGVVFGFRDLVELAQDVARAGCIPRRREPYRARPRNARS